MKTIPRRAALAAPAAIALAAPAVPRAQGAAFPGRPVSVLVPFAAGGPTDVISRLVAEGMGRDLGQPVVVENVTGAGGTIAAGRVAQARPDGHTLLMHHIGHASAATLYRRLPYDVLESFAPLGLASDAAMTLVARPDFPPTDLSGFMDEIRRKGEALNLAHSGLGAANHLCGMLLQSAAGTKLTGVVFRGSAPAITDMMAGRIDVFCDQATNTAPFLREGRIKGYAVTLPQRVPGLDLPTTAEAGQPSLLMSTWHGLYAPRGTPPEVQERLAAALRAALAEDRLRARFADLVTEPASDERATPAFPPPLPGGGGRAVAADHTGGRRVRGLTAGARPAAPGAAGGASPHGHRTGRDPPPWPRRRWTTRRAPSWRPPRSAAWWSTCADARTCRTST